MVPYLQLFPSMVHEHLTCPVRPPLSPRLVDPMLLTITDYDSNYVTLNLLLLFPVCYLHVRFSASVNTVTPSTHSQKGGIF
jgi:hypothetical protein